MTIKASLLLALLPALAAAQIPQSEYAQRRSALAAKLEDGIFVARGAGEPVQDYNAFFQSPGFQYLTGYREAGAALVMTKAGQDVRWTLFVQNKVPAVEVWSGRRNGAEAAKEMTGLPTRSDTEFEQVVDSLMSRHPRAWFLADISEGGDTLNGDDDVVRDWRQKHSRVEIRGANTIVAQLRATKSAAEMELIRKAVAISIDAHREAMKAAEPGMNEFEIQALVEYTFRRNGADRPAYASIVGSGENSTTLHYNRDDRFMQAGDMMVMDVGAWYRGYAADLTRSFPISGTFTPEQRAVYQIVRDAQAAAERNALPGRRWQGASDSAAAVIAAGLTRLGLIESPTATYDCGASQPCTQLSLYYMHGLGHGIGLEVHDPEQFYFSGTIAAGSAFSIEPGIYVRGNLLDIITDSPRNTALKAKIGAAVRKYANVGVRIEDNYVVTDRGLEWISCALPREADEIEALMRGPSTGPGPRDQAKVDWYKAPDNARNGTPAAPVALGAQCVKM
jgi:Xaa-Pro aminopeptidase